LSWGVHIYDFTDYLSKCINPAMNVLISRVFEHQGGVTAAGTLRRKNAAAAR
jgi:hypothetical protein